ncbi:N-acetyltransferase [Paenibacillus baekrokdamisoli]|uniref:N-acetyltransferase n=1 Tax=Paenibacillus baekrokdamisoli TaxID=1712516 RepID=A0A3G9JE72_9BACL|nr:GNAT family N-acetyltransferase [Paenibacillus baekrokdamisoli]MBB3072395.1 RimJ/RimL family protein N-acetyltransferase [Paenibacillus baekrokdamisoli]MBB3073297.1 RimJ/RimL family protein N-acetyltransferase [Paenibacillus baekrokdamisoli]BBH23265.1 N-acetyltransferase [Paenibacillus baekrokdamisoli]BBH23273.1 N-acetyltransferase [Paenibacillus baekrokdamisoli]
MSNSQDMSKNIFTIECRDIILREYQVEDLDELQNITWQPHFYEFLMDWNVSKEQREDWIKNYEIPDNKRFLNAVLKDGDIGELRLRLGIISKDSGEFIGVCGTGILDKVSPPNREIFYGISTDHRNKGYSTQAAKGLIKYLFDNTNVEELIAIAQLRNLPSNKVIQKCGFEFQNEIEIENRKYNYYKLRKN